MRTVFVNPSYSGTYKRRKRRNPYILDNPSGHRRRRRNPANPGFLKLGGAVRRTALAAAGAVGGAALNRLGASHVSNFYLRNGARVLAAAVLASLDTKHQVAAIAAAGAVLAPIVPEIEMQLGATAATKNPQELAAELADLLEADLGPVEDGELEDGEEIAAELSEDGDW